MSIFLQGKVRTFIRDSFSIQLYLQDLSLNESQDWSLFKGTNIYTNNFLHRDLLVILIFSINDKHDTNLSERNFYVKFYLQYIFISTTILLVRL